MIPQLLSVLHSKNGTFHIIELERKVSSSAFIVCFIFYKYCIIFLNHCHSNRLVQSENKKRSESKARSKGKSSNLKTRSKASISHRTRTANIAEHYQVSRHRSKRAHWLVFAILTVTRHFLFCKYVWSTTVWQRLVWPLGPLPHL